MAVAEYVCDECGEHNAVGTKFCVFCHAFLAWDHSERGGTADREQATDPVAGPTQPEHRSEQTIETTVMPRIQVPATGPPTAPGGSSPAPQQVPADNTAGRFRIDTDQGEVTVPGTGEPVTVTVRVTNTSTIVDGYVVDAPGAPDWLTVDSPQVQLLPGTAEELRVRMQVASDTMVPAQQIRFVLRIRSMSQAPAHHDLPVLVTVPVVDVPVQLRPEPRLLRVRDRDTAQCTLVVDNSGSNRAVRLQFAGSDPELAVSFGFEPAVLEVGPGTSGSVRVTATATGPEPGQEISRSLTLRALDGSRSVETLITFQQSTSAQVEDPPVTLEIQPSLVRVRDTDAAVARVVADNRGGTKWAHLRLKARGSEGLVHATWFPSVLDVPPGKTAQAEVRLAAPPPDAGTEVSRVVTVSATEGRRTATATLTLVQAASASPMETLAVRLEPSVVRVRDADTATSQVIVDNRRGRSGVRVFLNGSDLERAVGFNFSPAVVDLAPGQARAVALRLDSWRPHPGQESTRQFTVTAGDGQASVEASGSLVQSSSRAAIELLAVRLDPSVLRLSTARRGRLAVVVDNRKGAQPVRVTMRGDDPENSVRFTFLPAVLDIPPGRVATTQVSVKTPKGPAGQELTRPFEIMASDGRSEVRAEGSLIQSSPERRPLARLLFTLLGGLAMIVGAFGAWAGDLRGMDLTADFLAEGFKTKKLPVGGDLLSAGLVIAGLGVLVVFGLTGRSGRLTRLAALLAALSLIALFVAFALTGNAIGLGSGAVLVLVGCIAGYVGGLLARR